MSITEFLLARIDEEEAQHQEVVDWLGDPSGDIEITLTRREGDDYWSKTVRPYDPRRALEDCKIRRAIVTLCGAENAPDECWIILRAVVLPLRRS